MLKRSATFAQPLGTLQKSGCSACKTKGKDRERAR